MSELNEYHGPTVDRQNPDDPYFGDVLNKTGVTPLGYNLLVEIELPADLQRAQDEGIVIPETAADRHKFAAVVATVLQLSKDAYPPKDFPEGPWCKPGDYVVMSPHSGMRIHSVVGGGDLRFLKDTMVEGTVVHPDMIERGL